MIRLLFLRISLGLSKGSIDSDHRYVNHTNGWSNLIDKIADDDNSSETDHKLPYYKHSYNISPETTKKDYEEHDDALHSIRNISHNGVIIPRYILINPNRKTHQNLNNIEVFNKIVGNETRIRLSHYSESLISYDPIHRYFIAQKENQAIKSEFKINKDGSSYVMKFQGSWVCYDRRLAKCKKPSLFEIQESTFGFKIKYKGKCLSVEKSVVLSECKANSRNQDFIFEYDRELICKDNPSSRKNKPKSPSEEIKQEKLKFEKKIKKYDIPNKKTKESVWKLWSSKKRKWPSFGMC